VARPERVVLIHGAATTGAVWRLVLPLLNDFDVVCPDRASSGDLKTEVANLLPVCEGAVVVGVSGGATLGLELAARSNSRLAGCVLHEPAAGSLMPGLLAEFAAAYRRGGTLAFAKALYGEAWQPSDASSDADAVARDLRMFQAFEPAPPAKGCGPVLLTVGELSPPIRHATAAILGNALCVEVEVLPGARHAVHLETPEILASTVLQFIEERVRT
jgi:pimeloyl-ACP methyl ester carboxylesterase